MRKVWYHQIWIQNYLGLIVSDLMYICAAYIFEKVHIAVQFQQLSFKLLNFIFHPVKAVKSQKVFYSSHLQKKKISKWFKLWGPRNLHTFQGKLLQIQVKKKLEKECQNSNHFKVNPFLFRMKIPFEILWPLR